jgi:hypothetical protein
VHDYSEEQMGERVGGPVTSRPGARVGHLQRGQREVSGGHRGEADSWGGHDAGEADARCSERSCGSADGEAGENAWDGS